MYFDHKYVSPDELARAVLRPPPPIQKSGPMGPPDEVHHADILTEV